MKTFSLEVGCYIFLQQIRSVVKYFALLWTNWTKHFSISGNQLFPEQQLLSSLNKFIFPRV